VDHDLPLGTPLVHPSILSSSPLVPPPLKRVRHAHRDCPIRRYPNARHPLTIAIPITRRERDPQSSPARFSSPPASSRVHPILADHWTTNK